MDPPAESTAPAPASQMFAHHPALWASLGPWPKSPPTPHHGTLPAGGSLVTEPAAQPKTSLPQQRLSTQDRQSPQPRLPLGYRFNHLRRGLQTRAVPGGFRGHDGHGVAVRARQSGLNQQAVLMQHQEQHHPLSATTASSQHPSAPVAMNNILPLHRHRLLQSISNQLYDGAQHMYSSDKVVSVSSGDSQPSQQAAASTPSLRTSGHTGNSSSSATGSKALDLTAESPLGKAFWDRTAQLARLVSFPLRVSQAYYSYVPLGRQLYLEPQAVSSSLHSPVAPQDVPAPRPASPVGPAPTAGERQQSSSRSPASVSQDTAVINSGVSNTCGGLDVLVQRRRELLGRLWMHRMPTYRARLQQILFAAMGQTIPEASMLWVPTLEPSADAAAEAAGSPIAPQLQLARAETSAFALLSSSHLTDMLKVSPSCFFIKSACQCKCTANLMMARHQSLCCHDEAVTMPPAAPRTCTPAL